MKQFGSNGCFDFNSFLEAFHLSVAVASSQCGLSVMVPKRLVDDP